MLENSGSSSGLVGEILSSIGAAYGLSGAQTVNYGSAAHLVSAYKRAKAARPDDPMIAENAVNTLGYRLLANGMPDEAIQAFQLNVDLYPHSANAENSLAEAFEGAGQVAAALAHYRLAIDKIDQHGARNAGYARNRAVTQAKISGLAAKVSKHL